MADILTEVHEAVNTLVERQDMAPEEAEKIRAYLEAHPNDFSSSSPHPESLSSFGQCVLSKIGECGLPDAVKQCWGELFG